MWLARWLALVLLGGLSPEPLGALVGLAALEPRALVGSCEPCGRRKSGSAFSWSAAASEPRSEVTEARAAGRSSAAEFWRLLEREEGLEGRRLVRPWGRG